MPVSTRAHPVWTTVRTCLRHLTCKVDLLYCLNGRGFFLFYSPPDKEKTGYHVQYFRMELMIKVEDLAV